MKETTVNESRKFIPKTIIALSEKKRKFALEFICTLFIVLFVYTALSKLADLQKFKNVLGTSPLIGSKSSVVAWAVPISELVISALLFIPRTKSWGLYGSLLLMSVFTLYIGYMVLFTPELPCSCGGVISKMSWPQHFIFNIVFTLLALFGVFLSRSHPKKFENDSAPSIAFT